MRLWRIKTGRELWPFGDAVEDAFVFPSCLAELQEELCQRRQLERVDVDGAAALEVGPGLVLFDDAFVDGPALDHLVRESRGAGSTALHLDDDPLGRYLAPLAEDTRAVGLFKLDQQVRAANADALRRQLGAEARAVPLPAAAAELERLPAFPAHRPTLELPRARAVAARVRAWPHVLWLNQALAYQPRGPATRGPGGNEIAASARVHRTAYLERSQIGPDTVIEPHATLIDTCVGPSCHIADHSVLIGCAIGHHCHTLTDTYLRRVVSYPDSTLSSMGLEEVLIGRGVFLTSAVIFFPTVLGEPAQAQLEAGAVETGRPRLGGCVGHHAVLGTRAIFQPGRVVHNGYTVVMRPEEGVTRVDPAVATGLPSCWHQGRLMPVDQVSPGYTPPELD